MGGYCWLSRSFVRFLLIAKTKTRDWKSLSPLLDVKTDSQTAVSGVFNPKTGGTVSSAGVIMLVRYEIDSGDMVYVVLWQDFDDVGINQRR